MERKRRQIKTPKRFDEEPFHTPRSSISMMKQQQDKRETPHKEKLETPEKPEIPEKLEKQDNSDKSEKLEKSGRQDRPEKPERPVKLVKLVKLVRPVKLEKPDKPERLEKPEKLERPEKPEKIEKLERLEKQQQQQQQLQQSISKNIIKVKLTRTPTQNSPHQPKQPQQLQQPQQQQQQLNLTRPKTKRPRTPPAFDNLVPNLILPFWDARTAAEEHEDDNVKELVHCQCGIGEELGLMVQCEVCLTWQHAACLGMEKPEDAPDGYTCKTCSEPKFARESKRFAHDQDWLIKGRMKQLMADGTNGKRLESLDKINKLIDKALNIYKLNHSLKVKKRILKTAHDEDPELKLFKNPWPANFSHSDGIPFVPSAMAEIPVETVAEAALPDIGQLVDVSAILDNPEQEATTAEGFRANLDEHIRQMEEFINIEMSKIEKQLEMLEKDSLLDPIDIKCESLRDDLHIMESWIGSTSKR